MYRRASTTTLKQSLVSMNKDEILASIAGLRHISTVGEEEGEPLQDLSKHSNEDSKRRIRRSSTSDIDRSSIDGSMDDESAHSKKDD